MAFNSPTFPEGFELKTEGSVSLVPPLDISEPPMESSKSKQPAQPVATKEGQPPVQKPKLEAGKTKPDPTKGDQNIQQPGPRPVSKEFLITFGMLMSGNRVLLPRQVMPFSKGWRLLSDVIYYRWQMVVHSRKVETDDRLCTVLEPSAADDGSTLANRRSYSTSVRPDGCAGFTGNRFSFGKQFTLAEAQRLYRHTDCCNIPGPRADADIEQSILEILPTFYWDIGKEGERIANLLVHGYAPRAQPSIRHVFDVATEKWQWMYQLGGIDSLSPVVFSDRGGPTFPDAQCLHAVFGGLNIAARIYIGGCGLMPNRLAIDREAPKVPWQQAGILESELNFREVFSGTSAYIFNTAMFPIPTEKFRQKDTQSVDIRKVVNGPAISMVERIHGRPSIPGF